MFPLTEIQLLLEFARGRAPWSVDVFDAAVKVISYFGRMFLTNGQTAPIVGAAEVRISEQEAVEALEAIGNADGDGVDGHPVAGISPALVLAVLRFAIQLLATKV